jgi:hypothetical protein
MMSTVKLMSRIVAPREVDGATNVLMGDKKKKVLASLHDHTYGITSGKALFLHEDLNWNCWRVEFV